MRSKKRLKEQAKRKPRGPEIDKIQVMEAGVATVQQLFSNVFERSAGGRDLTQMLREIMDPKQLAIYELALRCETETLKCERAGAYLAGCLMGAAMIEAFLSLLCLFYKAEVVTTKHYKGAEPRETYETMVGNWKFEHLIRIAKELSWIPHNVVSLQVIVALIDVYRELMPMSDPDLSPEMLELGVAEFEDDPGIAMLRLIQSLRNSIHSGQWIRSGRVPDASHFDGWCQISIRLAGEVRNCLIHLMTTKNLSLLNDAVETYNAQIESLRSVLIQAGKDPHQADQIIEQLTTEVMSKQFTN
jgi:hypothetical protein